MAGLEAGRAGRDDDAQQGHRRRLKVQGAIADADLCEGRDGHLFKHSLLSDTQDPVLHTHEGSKTS